MDSLTIALLAALCLATACSSTKKEESETRLPTTQIALPNGKVIRAELAVEPADQQHGLMFRTRLAADRGMLFVFPQPGQHPFWMYQTLIPLDIVWLDASRRIVFISADTPPCPPQKGESCPNYGPPGVAQYVLELAAGAAAAEGLELGDALQF